MSTWFETWCRNLHPDMSCSPVLWQPYLHTRSIYLDNKYLRHAIDVSHIVPPPRPSALCVAVEDATTLPVPAFRAKYESASLPTVIRGGGVEDWPAMKWTVGSLSEEYSGLILRIANDNGGKNTYLKMTIEQYAQYCSNIVDESPMVVFDSRFGEKCPPLLGHYEVPKYFTTDYFDLLDNPHRPAFRWLLIAGKRSGSSWHVDPNGTSAWNTLLKGRKRWAFYPPYVSPPGHTKSSRRYGYGFGVDGLDSALEKNEDHPTPLWWFLEIYPTLTPDLKPIEVVQEIGDTVFVPSGWWHLVLNLEDTIAVTQNYVNRSNISNVMYETVDDEEKSRNLWQPLRAALATKYPYLDSCLSFRYRRSEKGKTDGDAIMNAEGYETQGAYLDSFKNLEVWLPRVKLALQQIVKAEFNVDAELSSVDNGMIQIMEGLNPIFHTEHTVVKFYPHLYESIKGYKVEVDALTRLDGRLAGCQLPHVLAHGNLSDFMSGLGWQWPFVVLSLVDGIGYEMVMEAPALDSKQPSPGVNVDRVYLAKWLGEAMAGIHTAPTDIRPRPDENYFVERIVKAKMNHAQWGIFPPHLVEQLDSYLPKSTKELFDSAEMVNLLHGDINPPNVRGVIEPLQHDSFDMNGHHESVYAPPTEPASSQDYSRYAAPTEPPPPSQNYPLYTPPSEPPPDFLAQDHATVFVAPPQPPPSAPSLTWTPNGIIDFADGHITGGDPHFDIAIMYGHVLACRPELLKVFLFSYSQARVKAGYRSFVFNTRRAMWYMLLYEFQGLLRNIARSKPRILISIEDEQDETDIDMTACPQWSACRTWDDIEHELWGSM